MRCWLVTLLEGEVRALKQRKADYDEARRQSDGSDSCWSGADSIAVSLLICFFTPPSESRK